MLHSGPFIVEKHSDRQAGVDFLGLGAVAERLIAELLPGITNQTAYLRPYSIASWIAWTFEDFIKREEKRDRTVRQFAPELFQAYREKVELLFTWANLQHKGAIGSRRKYPTTTRPVELSFTNPIFGKASRATWFAPAAYGPSFSLAGGLGFVEPRDGTLRATPCGIAMAQALDAVLRKANDAARRRLARVDDNTGSVRDMRALAPGLDFFQMSPEEREIFRASLYRDTPPEQRDDAHESRATSLKLMLRCIERQGDMAAHEVREAMALGVLRNGRAVDLTQVYEAQRLWFVVAVRQLERLALERLLRWLEVRLHDHLTEAVSIETLMKLAGQELQENLPAAGRVSAKSHLSALRKEIARGLSSVVLEREDLDLFKLLRYLEGERDESKLPARSLYCLLYCAAIVMEADADSNALLQRAYRLGGHDRVSLNWLAHYFQQREHLTLRELIGEVLRELVYGQHLRTAVLRAETGKSKFRFSVDDRGMLPLIPRDQVNSQGTSPDRIDAALRLMSDCGMLEELTDESGLTHYRRI